MRAMTKTRAARGVRAGAVAVLLAALAACQPSTPPPRATAPPAPKSAPAATEAAAPSAPAPAPLAKAPAATLPSMDLPPGPLYSCVVGGTRTAIEYAENVEKLCRRHPEMGPCQYERDACRKGGGRVYTAKGEEVTPAVEAAYDAKVRRVRFQADGGATKP
jgi:hypothetical protein